MVCCTQISGAALAHIEGIHTLSMSGSSVPESVRLWLLSLVNWPISGSPKIHAVSRRMLHAANGKLRLTF